MGHEQAKEGKCPFRTAPERHRRRRSLVKAPKFLVFGRNFPLTRGDLEHKEWTHWAVFTNGMGMCP